jgi:hypothetical protein
LYVRRLKTEKWGFFTPFAHYSWEPELAAMVIFQTVSVRLARAPPARRALLPIRNFGHVATPYMLVYVVSSATRKILGRIRSPAPSPLINANASLTLYFRFY